MEVPHIFREEESDLPHDERMKMAAAMQLMMQGREDADALFTATFIRDELKEDFPLIARDFIMHMKDGLKDYTNVLYGADSTYTMVPTEALNRKILNAMLNAASHGDSYTKELFREIHKIYYRDEYRILKRFRTLSYHELEGFENEYEPFEETAARILVLSPFLGIEIQMDCFAVYGAIHDFWNDEEMGLQPKTGTVRFSEELFRESLDCAEEIMRDGYNRRNLKTYRHYRKFIEKALEYAGFSEGWDRECALLPGGLRRGLAIVRSLLKTLYPARDYSSDELQLYLCLYELLYAAMAQAEALDENIDILLGREEGYRYQQEASFWKGIRESKPPGDRVKEAGKKKQTPGGTESVPAKDTEADRDALILENERLRTALRVNERNLRNIRAMYEEAQNELKESRHDLERAGEEHRELAALRDFAFHLTEEDIDVREEDAAVMEEAIRKKKIMIVGGHGNWTSQLKVKFPGWIFMKPGVSSANDTAKVKNADHVFFFTDTISHSTYGKFVHAVREQHIPFGYIHQTNIRANIRQIYEEAGNDG